MELVVKKCIIKIIMEGEMIGKGRSRYSRNQKNKKIH